MRVRSKTVLPIISILFAVLPLLAQQDMGSDTKHEPQSLNSLEKLEGVEIGKQYLVLIATDTYSEWSSFRGSRTPVNDSQKLKKEITTFYHMDRIIELYNNKATKAAIYNLLRSFKKEGQNQLSKSDSLFIYYAGHGELDRETDKGYWIPYDGGLNKISKSNWMDHSELTGLIKNIEADHILIVSDSCFSGALLSAYMGENLRDTEQSLKKVYPFRARKVLTSGAKEYVPVKSVFAESFRDALKKQKSRLYVKMSSIFNSIEDIVVKKTGNRPLYNDLEGVGSTPESRFILFTRKGWSKIVQTSRKERLYREYFEKAKSNHANKKYDLALEYILKAKEIKKTEEIRIWEESISDKKKLELLQPGEVYYKVKRFIEEGVSLYNEGQFEEAEKKFEEAMGLNPEEKTVKEYIQKLTEWKDIPEITPQAVVTFKRSRLKSLILPEVIVELYRKFPNLPPEGFLESLKKKRNLQGYWEVELDGHHMVYIPKQQSGKGGFFIDKYEVSFALLEQVKKFKKIRKKSGILLIQKSTHDNPALVTFNEAEAFCMKKGFQLPTEAQWELAAGVEKGNTYPWGVEAVDAGGIYRANYEVMEDKDGFDHLAPVNSFQEFASPYGLVNLTGNVWEWVQGRKCKGGGFMSKKEKLKITSSSMLEAQVGFRCVKEVGK